jgi:hypothetical protein
MSTASLHAGTERFAFLRRVLLADGLTCAAFGILLLIAAGVLADPLGLSSTFLRWVGLSLIPISAGLMLLSGRVEEYRGLVWGFITANVLWIGGSVLLLLSAWVDPTTLGVVFIVLQAIVVVGFVEMQIIAMRRTS